ncbi:DUF2306 domain-containing protein [Microbacterium sp. 2FI]|uniref:DUF2306 domain-containing protein n=1 Tax=Microbacterium sp. 2FI TaxID=2502193 RepID=UPI0010F47F4F|nr:DUF2306 domain-containing protein [Microbacterium sp. 2FI]
MTHATRTLTRSPSSTPSRRSRPEWLAPAGLIALTLIPMTAGSARLAELAGGAEVTASNSRFFEAPVPVVIHIVASTLYLLVGALQFAPSLRRRRWHRRAGRVLAPAGLASAASGMWMAVFYDLPAHSDLSLMLMRLVLGSVMAFGIVYAVVSILRGDVRTHSAWMTRAYAIGLGAGTQVLTVLPWVVLVGEPSAAVYTVLMGAGWAINLAVAEVVIRRRRTRTTGPVRTAAEHAPAGAARLS